MLYWLKKLFKKKTQHLTGIVTTSAGKQFVIDLGAEMNYSTKSLTSDTLHRMVLENRSGWVFIQGDKIDNIEVFTRTFFGLSKFKI